MILWIKKYLTVTSAIIAAFFYSFSESLFPWKRSGEAKTNEGSF